MPGTSAPSPAYTATLTTLPLDSDPMRQARLSARQHRALDGLQVPIVINPHEPLLPCAQAEAAIETAVEALLRRRDVSIDLWRDKDAGDLCVWLGGRFVPIAAVELTPAQRAEVAA